MPQRATRRCNFPGCTHLPSRLGRCQRHARQHNTAQHRLVPTKAARQDPAVRAHRTTAVKAHVAEHGWRCLGDNHHDPHDTHDLVADDPIPIARGGNPLQDLKVMCRQANSAKGAR